MRAANCTAYPERWRTFYDAVMDDFDKNGCALTDPSYYDALGDRYGILQNYRDVYKTAAVAVGKNEALSRLLSLLTHALSERETVSADLKGFKSPVSPDGTHRIEYDMLTGLAICVLVPYSYEKMKKRGYPEDIIREILATPEKGIPEYRKRNDGLDGYHLIEWFQRSIEGNLFRMGRLEIEIHAKFPSRAIVFKNNGGEICALAHELDVHRSGDALGMKGCEDEDGAFYAEVAETDDAWRGHPYLDDARVSADTVTLPKSEWTEVLRYGDPIVSLHIPGGEPFTSDLVDDALKRTKEFLSRYCPDYHYKAFYCGSWLLATELEEMLGAESNIVKFGKRFYRQTRKCSGNAVFNFVFLRPNSDVDVATLPENTRLERAIKRRYLDGKIVRELAGFFF